MGLLHKTLLGIKITISSESIILEEIKKYLTKGKSKKAKVKNTVINPLIIYTPNPEIISFAQKNDLYRKIVNASQIAIPDGFGVCWAMQKIQKIRLTRICGVDLMISLCAMASKSTFTIGLIGGRQSVALKALECLQEKSPGLKGWAIDGPEIKIKELRIKNNESETKNNLLKQPFRDSCIIIHDFSGKTIDTGKYFSDLVREIIKQKIDILCVALGHPKQEYFIDKIKSQKSEVKSDRPLVIMAVGGSFDYISGRVPRAPVWMQNAGMEWLYRLIREPWRWKRQFRGAEFFLRILLGQN